MSTQRGGQSAQLAQRARAATFQPEPRSVRSARQFVGELIDDSAQRRTAELLVSELATNAVRYAAGPFEVRVKLTPRVRVEVRDANSRFPSPMQPSADAERGRGLQIVSELARAWGVESDEGGGKVVWFLL